MSRPRKPRFAVPRNVHVVTAKGKEYASHQRGRGTKAAGPRAKLPWPPTLPSGDPNPEFWAAYRKPEPLASDAKTDVGTFNALVRDYLASPEWSDLSAASTRDYRRYLAQIQIAWGPLRVDGLTPKHILELRDAHVSTPAAANGLLRVLSAAISWSVPRQYRSDNPCQHVRRLKTGEGWAAWSWEAISTFRDDAVPEMWLAGALALYTGQRQADVLQMSWNDIDAGTIVVVQQKSGAKKKTVWIPIHRDLRTVLDAAPRRSTRILTNRNGHPWTSDGFRSVWADQMVCLELQSGILHGLVLHGLRKSAVCFLIEAGCTTAEVSAISGQSLQMVEHELWPEVGDGGNREGGISWAPVTNSSPATEKVALFRRLFGGRTDVSPARWVNPKMTLQYDYVNYNSISDARLNVLAIAVVAGLGAATGDALETMN